MVVDILSGLNAFRVKLVMTTYVAARFEYKQYGVKRRRPKAARKPQKCGGLQPRNEVD